MPGNDRNIYQNARLAAGITQEAAAEQLGLSPESMRAYETGQRLPPNPTVWNMVSVYKTDWLALEHLRRTSAGLDVLPEIRIQSLPTAVITLINRCADFKDRHRQLLRIAEDGVIDSDEQPVFDDIAEDLEGLIGAAYQVLYPAEGTKKDHPTAGTMRRSVREVSSTNDCISIINDSPGKRKRKFKGEEACV